MSCGNVCVLCRFVVVMSSMAVVGATGDFCPRNLTISAMLYFALVFAF